MSIDEASLVIGVFREWPLAEQAANDLYQAGWSSQQVQLLGRQTGGVLSALKSVFADEPASSSHEQLSQLGLSEDQRQFYQRELDVDHTIITVHSQMAQPDARAILQRHGAYDLSVRPMGANNTLQLRQEELQIHKEVIQVGEILIHKRIITENKTFTVPVTREEVTIERIGDTQRSVSAKSVEDGYVTRAEGERDIREAERYPANDASVSIQKIEALKEPGTISILVHEDVVLIDKQSIVVEEILIRKEKIEEMKQIVEPVRHEEVRIELKGNVPLHQEGIAKSSLTADSSVSDRSASNA